MSLPVMLWILFAVFYFGIGIGTALKFYDALTPGVVAKIVLFHPIQVILVSAMLLATVLDNCFERIRKDTHCGPVRRLMLKVYAPWVCFSTCVEFMPVVAGRLAYLSIKSKQIKHVMRNTRNDFASKLAEQITFGSCSLC